MQNRKSGAIDSMKIVKKRHVVSTPITSRCEKLLLSNKRLTDKPIVTMDIARYHVKRPQNNSVVLSVDRNDESLSTL